MNNRPFGNELLDIARRTLLDDILKSVPADKAYDVLMIANAMAIAARELAGVSRPDDAADKALAAHIRARDLPARAQSQLHALLLEQTRSALALSNPKYLQR